MVLWGEGTESSKSFEGKLEEQHIDTVTPSPSGKTFSIPLDNIQLVIADALSKP